MSNLITLLGTGTCQLQIHRRASGTLVELDDLTFLFDIGRGVAQRLFEHGVKQDDLQHIVLSHFHPDHWSDLVSWVQAGIWSRIDKRTAPLHIYAPIPVKEKIAGMIDVFGLHRHKGLFDIIVYEIDEHTFEIAGKTFHSTYLHHAENRGLKFEYQGKTYAFTGDSDVHDTLIEFLTDVDVAIIDAGHPSDEEIIKLAVQTQVKEMYLSHLYREIDQSSIQAQAEERGYTGRMIVAEDGMEIKL